MMTLRLSLVLVLSTLSALAELPPDAKDLKARRDAKIAEIDRTYAAELDKLQKKAMTAGNLQAANEIQKEIERVTANPFKGGVYSPGDLVGKWKWTLSGRSTKTVKREFTETHLIDEAGGKHPYTINGSIVTIDWSSGMWEKLTIDASDKNTMKGVNHLGSDFIYKRL